ncbi:small regulatory polypeptide of amino acid response [Echinops telfairi]|uniref:Small regulatory polypeptide of amino acid response n=1 Tax=Echinops telfairi TaxID=9371 RepID=A0ABM1VJL2_ECHTE|nr:small regulatory polypeptide of amino acid response [Echinops telfairi]
METAVLGMVAVLFVVTVAIACVLCCFSCDPKTQDPQGAPGPSFTVATFRQETSLFSIGGHHTQPARGTREFWTFV